MREGQYCWVDAANKKAYKLWDACKEEVVVSRDVLFEENTTAIRAFGDDTGSTEDGMEIDDDPSDTYTPQGNEASYSRKHRN